jgi:rhodanese-related sulfurtransferase
MALPVRSSTLLLAAAIVVAGALPPILYWHTVGSAPTVSARVALATLRAPASRAALVDVRAPEDFAMRHIEGALNWPARDIAERLEGAAIPEAFRDKELFLICDCGVSSAFAARELAATGVERVASVRGGMDAWTGAAQLDAGTGFNRLQAAGGIVTPLPHRASALYEQWAAVATGFGVKPTYMLLALALAVMLRRSRAPDLAALRWAFIFFFAGEAFCAINYGVFGDDSYLSEYLHSFGMVLCFGCTTYALFEGLDRRLIHHGDAEKPCAALALCRGCIKYVEAPCGLKRCFFVAIPAAAIMAFMPLAAVPRPGAYLTTILGTPYLYSHPIVYQFFELRICPILGLALLAVSFAVLLCGRRDPVARAKFLFAAGTGYLGFGLFRLFLFAPFADNQVWFAFWEEVTELLFIAGAAAVLWFFRHGLFAASTVRPSPDPAADGDAHP